MASTTPRATPDFGGIYESPFNSRSLTITVGPLRTPFSIHDAKLRRTAFFDIHKPSEGEQHAGASTVAATSEDQAASIQVKSEDGSVAQLPGIASDYHVEDRFFLEPAAFDVFTKFLYSEPPARPTCRKELKTLLQAYGIAVKYCCYELQNKIIDCIREYHARTKVKLDDLIWTVNRFGDDALLPLTKYLIEQTAFEIAENGYHEFATANTFFKTFLEERDRKVRRVLFEALTRHAQNQPNRDPAEGLCKFHVFENGERTGQPKS